MTANLLIPQKITSEHLGRRAVVYVRQSSEHQVRHNLESQRMQYDLVGRAQALGWTHVDVIDADLGVSAGVGAVRAGFDRLLAAVARGEVGIVFAREVSRLSRNDKDFCRLVELCQAFGTLLGDGEQVYDPALMDDHLVLGIKGTLSVVELRTLRLRLIQGMQNKAKRGEFRKKLPVGYAYDELGQVRMDPDERVRQAIGYIFEVFEQTAGIRQTMLRLHQEGFECPVHRRSGPQTAVTWHLPRSSYVAMILHNPCYAGAYVWGRKPVEHQYADGRLVRKQGHRRSIDDCAVALWDHHPGYITPDQYQEHLRMMQRNDSRRSAGSPIRTGKALLAGLLRCGRCGRLLKVNQWKTDGTAGRYLCDGTYVGGGSYCLGLPGRCLDHAIAAEMVRVLSPLGLQASVEALQAGQVKDLSRHKAIELRVEQAQYEAQVAQERYEHVDARNRLVAADLEQRWNAKLQELEQARAALAALESTQAVPHEDQHSTILWLGANFEQVWQSEHCPFDLKKRLVRAVIAEIVVDSSDSAITLVIHWQGGSHTRLEVARPKWRTAQANSADDIAIIAKLAPRYTDDQISRVLSRQGRATGKRGRWTRLAVQNARRKHGIDGGANSKRDPDMLSLAAAQAHTGVSDTTLRRLVEAGLLVNHQTVAWAPWELRRQDLDTEPVAGILEHLRRTGRLVLHPIRLGAEATELPLFQGDVHER